jgi:hypothetical protein
VEFYSKKENFRFLFFDKSAKISKAVEMVKRGKFCRSRKSERRSERERENFPAVSTERRRFDTDFY